MAKAKTYTSLQKEIDALLAQQEVMKEAVAKSFADRIAKDKRLSFLYSMPKRDLDRFAGIVCSNMPDMYEQFKEYEETKKKAKTEDLVNAGSEQNTPEKASGSDIQNAGYGSGTDGGNYGYGQM